MFEDLKRLAEALPQFMELLERATIALEEIAAHAASVAQHDEEVRT